MKKYIIACSIILLGTILMPSQSGFALNKRNSYDQVLSNGDSIGHCSKHYRKYKSRRVGVNQYKVCIRLLPCYIIESNNEARAIEQACEKVSNDQKTRNLQNRF